MNTQSASRTQSAIKSDPLITGFPSITWIWLATGPRDGKLTIASELGDPTGSPAERLIYYFSHPDAVRQLGPSVSAEDRVKAAYAIAIEDGWPEDEMDKLDAWRREVLEQGRATGG